MTSENNDVMPMTSPEEGHVTGSEPNNNKQKWKLNRQETSIFDKPRIKNVVFKAMAKDRDEKFEEGGPPRRRSGPSRYGNALPTPILPPVPELFNRRMSDTGVRRVRKTSALNYRRLSLRSPILEEEDPLEYLLQIAGTPVTSESRGAFRRFSSILNQQHVSGLCSGFSLGVSVALMVKSALILLMILWSFRPG